MLARLVLGRVTTGESLVLYVLLFVFSSAAHGTSQHLGGTSARSPFSLIDVCLRLAGRMMTAGAPMLTWVFNRSRWHYTITIHGLWILGYLANHTMAPSAS
jgi:hypothetical protein